MPVPCSKVDLDPSLEFGPENGDCAVLVMKRHADDFFYKKFYWTD